MYRQILELEKKINGFNRISFDFSDFLNICEQEDIRFYFYPFPAPIKGVYINLEFPVIGLKEGLKSPELELVAFQELGHYFLGHPNSFTIEKNTFWLDKIEYQAKVFSALCLIPTPVLETEKDGIAICKLEDGRCSGCSIYVPTYIEEKVKKKKEIVQCENCSRILY